MNSLRVKKTRKVMHLLQKVEVSVNEHWCSRMPLEHKKSMIHYIKKNEDKIRRSTNTSAPISVKISYVITLDPLVEKMESLVCMVG